MRAGHTLQLTWHLTFVHCSIDEPLLRPCPYPGSPTAARYESRMTAQNRIHRLPEHRPAADAGHIAESWQMILDVLWTWRWVPVLLQSTVPSIVSAYRPGCHGLHTKPLSSRKALSSGLPVRNAASSDRIQLQSMHSTNNFNSKHERSTVAKIRPAAEVLHRTCRYSRGFFRGMAFSAAQRCRAS